MVLLFLTSCEKETPAIVEEDLNGFRLNPDIHDVEGIMALSAAEQKEIIANLSRNITHQFESEEQMNVFSIEGVDPKRYSMEETDIIDLRSQKDKHARATGDRMRITPSNPNGYWSLKLKQNNGTWSTLFQGKTNSILVFLPILDPQICNYYGYYEHMQWDLTPVLSPSCHQFSIEYEVDSGGLDTDLYNIPYWTHGYFATKYDWNLPASEVVIMPGNCHGGWSACSP